MGYRGWTYEEKLDVCRMRIEGDSLEKIGQKYGVTRECIRLMLHGLASFPKVTWDGIVFPYIKNWLIDKNMSVRQFGLALHIAPSNLDLKLKGRVSFVAKEIVKIHDFTGIPFEKIFEREEVDTDG